MTTHPALSAVTRSLAWHRTRFEAFTRPATALIVREIRDARVVVDLASGTGDPALTLAAALPRARVLALDRVAEFLNEAAREARARRLSNLETLQADLQAVPLPAASVDAVTSRLGIQFAQDAAKMLAEIRRVLQPGGITCHVVWGAPGQPLLREMLRAGSDGPKFVIGEPGPFQFSRPGSLSEALATAGFEAVEEQTHTNDWVWQGDARSFWDFMQETSGAALAADEHTALARLKVLERNDTLALPVEVHCARARTSHRGEVHVPER